MSSIKSGRIGTVTVGLSMGIVMTLFPIDPRAQGVSALEEIVVTARRREENLQQVPVAITALGAEDLEIRSIENIKDLQMLLPNVDIRGGGTTAGAGGLFAIRGIPGVARYIDDVVQSSGKGALQNVVELERIEVLRGPQGTYFGKNAISGAIQYVTQKPQEEFGARIKTTFGQFNRADIVANVDIPLSDTVLTKITAASLNRDGYVESLTVDEDYGEIDNTVLRGMLQWQPNDSFTGLFTATYINNDENMQANVLFDIVENFPTPWPWGGGPEWYNRRGIPFTDENYAYGIREEYVNTSQFSGTGIDTTDTSFTANLTWDFSDAITIRSITAVRDQDWGIFRDMDATEFVFFDYWTYEELEETTQEFQFLGSGDRFEWVVGVYYHDSGSLEKDQIWENWEMPGWVWTNWGPMGMIRQQPRFRHQELFISREDTAVFAEGVYSLTEQLSLTVGGRFSKEAFHSEVYTNANGEGVPPPQVGTKAFGRIPQRDAQGVPFIFDADFDAFTPRIALQYQFNDNVMAYVTGAQGFNGGGVNSRFDSTLPNNGITPYDGELLTNYEVGVRSDLFDNRLRLNATYFAGTWDGIQVGEVLTAGATTTTNAGEAEISGLEVEGLWRASDSFGVNFTLSTLDTEYTDVGLATTIQIGDRFPFAPESGYSIGLQWDNDLSGGGSITARFDYGWIDDVETFRDRRFHFSARANDAYGLASGRIVYTPAAGNWDIALLGTNLTDEYFRLGGFSAVLAGIDQGVVGRPREIGVTIRLRLQ